MDSPADSHGGVDRPVYDDISMRQQTEEALRRAKALIGADGNAWTIALRDAYDRLLADLAAGHGVGEVLLEHARLNALSAAIGRALTQSDNLQGMLQRCAAALVHHLGAALASIWTFNDAEQILELQASAGRDTYRDDVHSRVPVGQGTIGRIAQGRQPYLTNAVIGDPRLDDPTWAKREGLVALVGYPLLVAERLVGVLALFAREPFSATTPDAIASVARALAQGIERKWAEDRVHREAQIVDTLHRVGRSLMAELDLPKLVQAITDVGTALTGAQFGAFFYNVIDAQGEAYRLYTLSGAPREAFADFPMPRNTALFGPTFRGEAVIRLADVTKDPRYGKSAPHYGMPPGHLPVRSYLAVPVVSRAGKVLGGLFFGHPEAGRFDEYHERLAVGLAGQAAVALDNARLYEAERRARAEAERVQQRLTFLAEVSTVLSVSLDYTARLHNLAHCIVPYLADWCVIDMLEDDGWVHRLALAHKDPAKAALLHEMKERYPKLRPDAVHTLLRVLRTRQSWLRPELPEEQGRAEARDARHWEILQALGFLSEMVVPLIARGRVLGTITFVLGPGERRYGPDDLALAEELTRRCAMAIDNARLYREAQDATHAHEESLALLDTLLTSAPVGLGFLDPQRRYVRLNQALAQISGLPIEAHLGRTPDEITPSLSPALGRLYRYALDTGTPVVNAEVSGETRAAPGQQRHWLVSYYPMYAATGAFLGLGCVVTDITARKQDEQSLAKRAREQAALYMFTDRLHRAGSLHDIYDAALDALLSALRCDRASILLRDEAGVMRFVGWRGLSDRYRRAVEGHSPWPPDAQDPQPICMSDIESADFPEPLQAVVNAEGIRALAFIPLVGTETLLGKFMIYYDTPHVFSDEEIDLALTIGHQLAFGVERKQAEEARRREQELLQTIIDRIPAMITVYNPDAEVMRLNPEFARVVGWSSGEASGVSLMEECYPDPEYRAQVSQFMQSCRDGWMDIRMRTRDGRDIETSWANIRLSDRTQVGIGIDITERKRAEQRLLTQHTVTRALAESTTLTEAASKILQAICDQLGWHVGALWYVDPHDKVLRCSEVYQLSSAQVPQFEASCRQRTFELGIGLPGRVWSSGKVVWIPDVTRDDNFPRAPFAAAAGLHGAFGFPIMLNDEVLGVIEFFSREIRQPDEALLQMMMAIGSQVGQYIERKRAETSLRALTTTLEQRVAERTAALEQALAERQRLQQEARRAEHFALLGRLAAGVSHELRNPLAAVFLHVDLLAEELAQPSPDSPAMVAETLSELKAHLARVEDLMQDYLSLVRVYAIQREVQDLGAAMAAWAREFQGDVVAHGVTLQVEGLEMLGPVAFHASTLRRAFLNLIQNAAEATAPGGTISLVGQHTADQVRLHVRDTGSGIPAEKLARIFEPLHTTKPGGTGLGLYIVQEVVAAHGGQVTVQSVVGQGTTVTLTLPRAATTPSTQESHPPPADQTMGAYRS